jgi:hemolysin activation/secretion protein
MQDQQLFYQFSASDNFFSRNGPVGFLSNALSWTMPVRNTDSLIIFGNYQKSIPNIGSDFGYVGKSGQASIRYSIALHRSKHYVQTLQFGDDFKTTNNNLAFGGTDVSKTSTEIDQFPLAYAANLTDKLGASSFSTSVIFSPGQMTDNNTTTAFRPQIGQSGIAGASSHYTYWRTEFNRLNKLPKNGVYAFRVIGQTSTTNLLYTEKLSGGGPDILRGYDPYSVYGDRGVLMSNELRTAALKPWPEHALGEAQLYIFWDYGHLTTAQSYAGVVNSLSASSIGSGLRYNLRSNLSTHVDYGRALIQLPNTNAAARNSFVDLALTMAY